MAIGDLRHRVTLQTQGEPVPDGQGGYTQPIIPLTPAIWDCAINPVTVRELERVTSGTALTTATHVMRGRYRSDVTTETQLLFGPRLFYVRSVRDVDERHIGLELICEEHRG